MKLKHVAAVLIVLAGAAAESQSTSYNPAAKTAPNSRDGIVGFTLRQLNPENRDYGQLAAEYRRISIEAAIERVTFWVAMASLASCLVILLMWWHESRLRLRQEIIAANFLAMYHNGWVRASNSLVSSIEQYNSIVQKFNAVTERLGKLRAGSTPPEMATDPQTTSADAQARSLVSGQIVEPKPSNIAKPSSAGAQSMEPQKAKRQTNQVALLGQISALQQQLTAAREREKSLLKQLDQMQKRDKTKQNKSLSLFEPVTFSEPQEVRHAGEAPK